MGLFQGVGLPFQSESAPVQMPNMVWLYRVPILLYWAEHEETLGAIITHVLVHEIGHHFGLSDDDMYGDRTSGGITEEMQMKVTGACHCGAITIEGEADPEKVTICHCTDCQTGTGSAFRVSVPIPGSVVQDEGQPTNYVKTTADSGNPRVQAFCGRSAARRSIRPRRAKASRRPTWCASAFCEQRDQLAPKKQNWFRSARNWVTGMDAIPEEPEAGVSRRAYGLILRSPPAQQRRLEGWGRRMASSPALMAAIDNLHWIESGRRRHNGGGQIRSPP